MTFATDIDLLHWEPNLVKEATFVSQTLLATTGDLSGTTLTISGSSFVDAEVTGENIIYIGGAIDGTFPIVEVNSSTQLTLSVLYDKLFNDPATPGRGGPDATGVDFAIRTFWPQRQVVSDLILQAAGLDPGDAQKILNPLVLKRACVLGTLQMIYNALAAAATESSFFAARARFYEQLYKRSLRSARVELDLNGDGQIDSVRALNCITLIRG
ncbi:MAG TPA: hypothetical protein PLD59_15160 [Tepidisphaeraceae bacterium]|nr:hypothetical protein [Tepidisphaeraceae bacterium]